MRERWTSEPPGPPRNQDPEARPTVISLEEQRPSFATEAVVRHLQREDGWTVRRQRWSPEAVTSPASPPDLLLIEAPSPEDGIRRAAAARAACPSSRIVICGHVDDPVAIAASLDAGADDVVRGSTALDEVLARVRRFGTRR